MRKIPPWVGKTDDDKVPLQTQLRILLRQGGKCAISGRRFMVGDKKHLDHKIPLADGGRHTESNLRWVLASEHQIKTSEEASVRARARRIAAKHAGLERRRKINWVRRKEPKEPLEVVEGKTAIARRFGL